jgi:hypothetical protein
LNHLLRGFPKCRFFRRYAPSQIKVERTSRKDARASEKPILSHLKLPCIIITFRKLSFHMVFIIVLKSGDNKMYLTKWYCNIRATIRIN